MGNNYNQQQHTQFVNQMLPTRAITPSIHHHAVTKSSGPTTNEREVQGEASLISKISANYIMKLPQYYSSLYERLPKSVLVWQIQQIQTWLDVIGMKSQYHRFCQLAIDGSSVILLDMADLHNEIGIRSQLSLGILQAWIQLGFKEYEKFVQQKEREIKHNINQNRNVQRIDKMTNSVNKAFERKKQKQVEHAQTSNIKVHRSEKGSESQLQYTLINTQKNKPVSTQANRQCSTEGEGDHQRNFSIKKLEVFDKCSNICLEVEKFPKGLMEQFENIYRQFGIDIGKEDKQAQLNNKQQQHVGRTQQNQQSTKNSLHSHKNQHKQSLRRQLCSSMLVKQRNRLNYSHSLYDRMIVKQYQRLVDSLEIYVTRSANTNNMNEYRFAFMLDPGYDINASSFLFRNIPRSGEDDDILGTARSEGQFDDTELSMMRKKVNMTRRYQHQQSQQQTGSASWRHESHKLQVNAYMLLNQPTLIPQPRNFRTKTNNQSQTCRSYSEQLIDPNKGKHSRSVDFHGVDDGWRFVIGELAYLPQFEKLENMAGDGESAIGMWLTIVGTHVRLKVNPYQHTHDKQTPGQQSYQIFYIVSHRQSRHPQILTSSQMSRLSWSKQQDYTKICAIVYIQYQRQYYLCQPTQVRSLVNNKIKEGDQKKKGKGMKCREVQGTNKKQKHIQESEQEYKMNKTQGLRRKQYAQLKHVQSRPVQDVHDDSSKYESNREQYNKSSIAMSEDHKIWVKLAIYPYSNKLSPENSIKIVKGTTLRLGRRQYSFNINTTLFKYVQPGGRAEEGYISKQKPGKGQAITSKCIVCYERPINCLYLDCKHSVTCLPCGKLLEKCPICRNSISDYLRIYTD